MSQKTDILTFLKTGQSLSPIRALEDFGCFRLAARIRDLKDAGNDIKTTMFHDARTNKRYAIYWMVK